MGGGRGGLGGGIPCMGWRLFLLCFYLVVVGGRLLVCFCKGVRLVDWDGGVG